MLRFFAPVPPTFPRTGQRRSLPDREKRLYRSFTTLPVSWNFAPRRVAGLGMDMQRGLGFGVLVLTVGLGLLVATAAPAPLLPLGGSRIESLIHNARGALHAGDQITVTLRGTPGGSATFHIFGVITNVGMREIRAAGYQAQPALYTGT